MSGPGARVDLHDPVRRRAKNASAVIEETSTFRNSVPALVDTPTPRIVRSGYAMAVTQIAGASALMRQGAGGG